MKKLLFFVLIMFTASVNFADDKKILVEIFTNSHCGVCPNAHNAINNYIAAYPDKINYIYYHMSFPYSDDPLNIANPLDPAGRNNYYGPFIFTPVAFFDGVKQQNNYSSWEGILNQMGSGQSLLNINLTGSKAEDKFDIKAEITAVDQIANNDLVIHFVVVEDVTYTGRNGISEHKHTMRKMITSPTGESFSISNGETKNITKNINIETSWDINKVGIVVFIQSAAGKNIYQSAYIKSSELTVTGVNDNGQAPIQFNLGQNYPNPFNPSTNISYSIADRQHVSLKVFDVLGNEIAVLVNETKSPGSYSINFSAEGFNSGVYFYSLETGSFKQVKKMIFLK